MSACPNGPAVACSHCGVKGIFLVWLVLLLHFAGQPLLLEVGPEFYQGLWCTSHGLKVADGNQLNIGRKFLAEHPTLQQAVNKWLVNKWPQNKQT